MKEMWFILSLCMQSECFLDDFSHPNYLNYRKLLFLHCTHSKESHIANTLARVTWLSPLIYPLPHLTSFPVFLLMNISICPNGPLVLGYSVDYFPYVYEQFNGDFNGIFLDLFRTIAKEFGCSGVELRKFPLQSSLLLVQSAHEDICFRNKFWLWIIRRSSG